MNDRPRLQLSPQSGRVNWAVLLAVALLLIVVAVAGGIYIGKGAGQAIPVKDNAASDLTMAPAASGVGLERQSGQLLGRPAGPASGSVATPAANDPGAIVAPGGVELQRPEAQMPHQAPASANAASAVPDAAALPPDNPASQ